MDFEALYLQYYPAVYRQSLRLTHSHERAEDLAQDTFERALVAFDRFDGANPGGWLYRICYNLWVGERRRKFKFVPLEIELNGEAVEVNADPLDLEALVLDRDEIAGLIGAGRRELFLWGLGYGYKEIAGITGLKMSNLKSRMRRARLKL